MRLLETNSDSQNFVTRLEIYNLPEPFLHSPPRSTKSSIVLPELGHVTLPIYKRNQPASFCQTRAVRGCLNETKNNLLLK